MPSLYKTVCTRWKSGINLLVKLSTEQQVKILTKLSKALQLQTHVQSLTWLQHTLRKVKETCEESCVCDVFLAGVVTAGGFHTQLLCIQPSAEHWAHDCSVFSWTLLTFKLKKKKNTISAQTFSPTGNKSRSVRVSANTIELRKKTWQCVLKKFLLCE